MKQETQEAAVSTLAGVLDELGARFGATGAHLWEEMVQHHVAMAVSECLMALIFLAVSAFLIRKLITSEMPSGILEEDIEFVVRAILIVILCVCVASGFTALLVDTSRLIGVLVSPEASLLKSLMP